MFKGLGLPGKEFILPNISSLWLMEEFVVHPDVSDQIELKSYPTSILDESCISEVTKNTSIPLVESVEAFDQGPIDNPLGHSSVKQNVDSPLIAEESHGVKPVVVGDADCHAVSSDCVCNQVGQSDASASIADSQMSSYSPQLALVNDQLPVAGVQQLDTLSAK